MRANVDETPQRGGYIGQAWLVILLTLIYGGALAGVQIALGPVIAQNRKNETYDVIPKLVPRADKTKTVEMTLADAQGKQRRVYRAVAADGSRLGWVVPAGGQGFADRIDLLIGTDNELSLITGLYVLDQKETPGLGNFITGDSFRDQFVGKPTDEPVVVVKLDPAAGGNEILALSGATISSDSVAAIVNSAIDDMREPIRQLTAKQDNQQQGSIQP